MALVRPVYLEQNSSPVPAAWQRARSADIADKLRQAIGVPLRVRVREIVEGVLVGPCVTQELADLLRGELRALSAVLKACEDVERPLRDFT